MSATDAAIVVPVELIKPNPWNPNVQSELIYQKELASISKYGFVDPLTVREIQTKPTALRDALSIAAPGEAPTFVHYEIIDGEHRWRAAKELGYTELPCWNLGVIDDDDARELTIVLNETRGQPDEDRLRALLQDLVMRRGETPVREIMPFSRERFDELLQRRQVDWSALEERRQQLQTEGRWKELVFRMPRDSAKVVEDAIDLIKEREGFEESWRALEMICADSQA